MGTEPSPLPPSPDPHARCTSRFPHDSNVQCTGVAGHGDMHSWGGIAWSGAEVAGLVPTDFDVRRLQLQPGDWVVLQAKVPMPSEKLSYVQGQVGHTFPDNKVLVLDYLFDIVVLTATQVAAALAT